MFSHVLVSSVRSVHSAKERNDPIASNNNKKPYAGNKAALNTKAGSLGILAPNRLSFDNIPEPTTLRYDTFFTFGKNGIGSPSKIQIKFRKRIPSMKWRTRKMCLF